MNIFSYICNYNSAVGRSCSPTDGDLCKPCPPHYLLQGLHHNKGLHYGIKIFYFRIKSRRSPKN